MGTAGLTLGITPQLDSLSKVVLILFMFVGRVGWMMLIFSLLGKNQTPPIRRVSEKNIGWLAI
ncbi:potassium transporter TrkG [Lactococcus fujiensis]|uniref:potassium transporter TrkG n=1 Tax=Lactococcus fujiensis TaxID=610251 RepID=UPI000B258888|nr:potassium transporter TrkG [Lactococcus fujiensis]